MAEEHEVLVHAVALLERGGLPRTTSGKARRGACRAGLAAGTLQEVARWVSPPIAAVPATARAPQASTGAGTSAQSIQRWMIRRLAQRLACPADEIDPRRPLAEYGLDSRALVELSGHLQSWLARPVPPHLLYSHPTIAALAQHLAETSGAVAPGDGGDTPPDAVAIIGIGCRFPGGIDSPEAYWRLLRSGSVALSDVPPDRWDIEALFDANLDAPGKMYTRRGGFLDAISRFDAAFFGIAPREAASLDPQQRMVLEVGWEALERAGQPPVAWKARARASSSASLFRARAAEGQKATRSPTFVARATGTLPNSLSAAPITNVARA